MKTWLSKKISLSTNPDKNSNISVNYSKADFFYEGQECRSEEKVSIVKEKRTDKKDKKRDRFLGNFNMFF